MKVFNDHVCKCELLLLPALLETTLHDTAPMLVRAYLNAVSNACLKDELGEAFKSFTTLKVRLFWVLGGLKDTEKGLNHMITVRALVKILLKSVGCLTKLSSFIEGLMIEITWSSRFSDFIVGLLRTSTTVCTALVPCTFIDTSTRFGLM
jgi:hypothetical protein